MDGANGSSVDNVQVPDERTGPDYRHEREALLARPALAGPARRAALTELTDVWLAKLFERVGGLEPGFALVAVGSYGRAELSPGSDLDLLLLRPPGPDDAGAAHVASGIWYPIWDSGTSLDHSMRTPAEARRVAAHDLKALLGLLDARHLVGDEELTATLRRAVLADWRALARKRLPELLAQCRERAARAGDLAFALEPDLKESRGGLRDLVVLRALAASWVADMPHDGLDEARSDLLDVRDALHASTGRNSDRLVLQEQDAVAALVGLQDGETLIRRVSGLGRAISYAADDTWYRVERVLARDSGRRSSVWFAPRKLGAKQQQSQRFPLADGVVAQDGEVVLARDARPAHDHGLVLRAAAATAQAGLRLAPHALARFAEEWHGLPEPWSPESLDDLVSLLGAGRAQIPVWEALDASGLTTRLVPGWERVRNRPQRNPVHRFTVDRHLIETAAVASGFARRVDRPDLLLVGALLHDIGKGWLGDHSEAGVAVVADVAPRMGFDPPDVAILVTLVRHHLLLPDTALRRDLEDPATIDRVASSVGNVEVLDLLHALTEADALATGPAAWDDWKARLVSQLVEQTRAVLGGHTVAKAPEFASGHEVLIDEARSTGLALAAEPVEHGLTITVAATDRVGLLADIAGALSLSRLEVRSATTQTIGTVAVQEWQVRPEFGEAPALDQLRQDIRVALEGRGDLARRLAARDRSAQAGRGHVPAPTVELVPDASDSSTVIEVRAHDRPALLFHIATALAAADVDVRSARVGTLGSEAVDVFYIVGVDGQPLPTARAEGVARAVCTALG